MTDPSLPVSTACVHCRASHRPRWLLHLLHLRLLGLHRLVPCALSSPCHADPFTFLAPCSAPRCTYTSVYRGPPAGPLSPPLQCPPLQCAGMTRLPSVTCTSPSIRNTYAYCLLCCIVYTYVMRFTLTLIYVFSCVADDRYPAHGFQSD